MTMKNLLALARQFIVFGGVGAVNTVLGLALILFFSEIAGFHYIQANVAGYGIGLCFAFLMHRNITFRREATGRASHMQVVPFLTVFGVAYAVQFLVLVLLVDGLDWDNVIGQIIACGVYAIVGFMGHKYLTFKAPEKNNG